MNIPLGHRNNHITVKNIHYKLDKSGLIGNIVSRFFKIKISKDDLTLKNREIWEAYLNENTIK